MNHKGMLVLHRLDFGERIGERDRWYHHWSELGQGADRHFVELGLIVGMQLEAVADRQLDTGCS